MRAVGVGHDEGVEMEQAARTYCALLEQPGPLEAAAFVGQVLTALADVIAAALRLPESDPGDADLPARISHEQWRELYRHVGQLLGPHNGYYWEADHPFDLDVPASARAGTGLGDLDDDLADTWRDLKSGLLALDAGASPQEVSWQWRQDYWTHWGHHAASALRVLMLHATGRGQRPPRDS